MRWIRHVVIALIVSLTCVGTYVVQAAIARGIRTSTLTQLDGQTTEFLKNLAPGQIGGALPPSAELEVVTRRSISSFQNQSFESLFDALPVWRKERVALTQARAKAQLENDRDSDKDDYAELFKREDPAKVLKLTDKQSFLNLSKAQFFALSNGLLKIHEDAETITRAREQWFMVDAQIGALAPYGGGSGSMMVLQNGAMTTFENISGDTARLIVLALDNTWVVTGWEVKIGGFRTSFSGESLSAVTSSSNEAKSSEARAALGTIKDRLRVKYVQNNNDVDLKWQLSDLVNTTELRGKYYGSADYSMTELTKNTATFVAAANTMTSSPRITMEVTNIQTGAATIYAGDTRPPSKTKEGMPKKDGWKDGPSKDGK